MKQLKKLALGFSTAGFAGTLCGITAFAESDSSNSSSTGWSSIIFLILIFVVLYFILIRPQRKKDKETKAMQSSLQEGDEIVTIGGIVGLVVKVSEDTIMIETGSNRNRIRIKSWAVQENVTVSENAKREQEEKVAAAKAKQEAKLAKKNKKKGIELENGSDSTSDGDILKD
ncbi:MAG: preprotein translocase subunit YajC [Ruminococcus sp.]|nr:preprotein translocase subunit YajC [Ruminococcus sp.]